VPLALISTKTSSAACSRNTIDPKREPMAVLAEFYRAYEGQPVERRFVSLRHVHHNHDPMAAQEYRWFTRRIIGFGVERADPWVRRPLPPP
jgi:hypothetical protein